jgi:hypothetical protein
MASLTQAVGEGRLASVVAAIPQLRAVASELFPGHVDISVENDADLGQHYVVVSVEAKATLPQIATLRREWYNRTEVLLGTECELVRLIVAVRE